MPADTLPPVPPARPAAPLLVWWVLWFALINGLIIQRVFLVPSLKSAPAGSDGIAYIALGPLVVSALIRFLLLPRLKTKAKAFPFFVAGLAMSEACGILGLFLGGGYRDTFVGIGLGMMIAYIPFFARRYDGGGNSSPFHHN